MGFGLPAAIGAQVAQPDKKVVLITGDGGLQMNSQELLLLKAYNIPVKVVIINNGYLGMVRQWQELFNQHRYSFVDLEVNPDFETLAKAYGVQGVTLSTIEDLRSQLRDLILSDEPVVINCVVEREENVFPMIPAGCQVLVITKNKPGIGARILSLFNRRGYSVTQMTSGISIPKDQARITLTVETDEVQLDQIQKQIYKLVDAIKVKVFSPEQVVRRELMLIKVKADVSVRPQIIQLADVYRGNVLDVGPSSIVIEITGETQKLDAFIEIMKEYGILEIAKTGCTAMSRGEKM